MSLEDVIAEVKAWEDAMNKGCWRIILTDYKVAEAHFVRSSEEGQYNLMTSAKYKTEQKARLALALMSRCNLSYTEHQELLALLEE